MSGKYVEPSMNFSRGMNVVCEIGTQLIDPADVRHQKNSFKEAFIKHETYGQDNEKMKQWRAALKGVAGISGWHSKLYLTDIELIKDIVKHLWKKVLQVPTGNFETFEATRQAMDEVMNVLKDDQVPVLGVYGVVGVGKTKMVKHVGAQAQKDGLFDRSLKNRSFLDISAHRFTCGNPQKYRNK